MISFILLILAVQQTQLVTAKKGGVGHGSRDTAHTVTYTAASNGLDHTAAMSNNSVQKTEFSIVEAGRSNKHDHAPKPADHKPEPHKVEAHKVEAPVVEAAKPHTETPAEVPKPHVPALEAPSESGAKASMPQHIPNLPPPHEQKADVPPADPHKVEAPLAEAPKLEIPPAETPKPYTPAETPAEVTKPHVPALEAPSESGAKASMPLHIPDLLPPNHDPNAVPAADPNKVEAPTAEAPKLDIPPAETPKPDTPAETPAEVPKPAVPALEAPSESGAKASMPNHIPDLLPPNPDPNAVPKTEVPAEPHKVDAPTPESAHPGTPSETPAEVPQAHVPALEAPSHTGAKAHIPDAHPNSDIPNPDSLKLGFDANGVLTNTEVSKEVIEDYVKNVKFYLYDDPKNLAAVKALVIGDPETLKHVTIPKKDGGLKLLIHGFMQDINSAFLQEIKDALLNTHGNPVICVDWGHMADSKSGPDVLKALFFPFIVNNIPTVGEYIGDFLIFLKDHKVIDNFDQIHVLGYGLGAHVSGIAGGYLQQKTTELLGRITGLDPSGPQFFLTSKERRLCFDDAKFVDIIHTSHLGYFMQLGHVDFFPNGGKFQPGCLETVGVIDTVESLAAILAGSCAHARAWQYYMQSLQTNTMFGCECNDIFKYEMNGCKAECDEKMPFGDLTPPTARGNYFLTVVNNTHT